MGEGVSTDIRARLRRESGAASEAAISLAVELRRLGFSHRTVVFELCRYHGYEQAAATRIVRIAAVRDFRRTRRQPNALNLPSTSPQPT